MFDELKMWNPQDDGHDAAIYIVCKKFEELHPEQKQPKWLKYCLSMKVAKNQYGNWVTKLLLIPKVRLEKNQYVQWEDDGIPILFDINPITGKKTIVISNGSVREPEIIFEAEVDFERRRVIVYKDTELEALEGSKYEMNITGCFR